MLVCMRFPQPVNNSHQQPLSHSPTAVTSIQSYDSLHILRYFISKSGKIGRNACKSFSLGNKTDTFSQSLVFGAMFSSLRVKICDFASERNL